MSMSCRDEEMLQRARAAIKLIRCGQLEPAVALALVVWPSELDDPRTGVFAVDKKHPMAA